MVLPRELAGTTQVCGNEALRDGTLRYLEPLSTTTLANGDRSYQFRLLFSPQSLSPESGGLPEVKRPAFYWLDADTIIWADSFYSASTLGPDRGRS